jgi:hypothetical protein
MMCDAHFDGMLQTTQPLYRDSNLIFPAKSAEITRVKQDIPRGNDESMGMGVTDAYKTSPILSRMSWWIRGVIRKIHFTAICIETFWSTVGWHLVHSCDSDRMFSAHTCRGAGKFSTSASYYVLSKKPLEWPVIPITGCTEYRKKLGSKRTA